MRTETTPMTRAEADFKVRLGAAALDERAEHHPELQNWRSKINIEQLDLEAMYGCVLGQLAPLISRRGQYANYKDWFRINDSMTTSCLDSDLVISEEDAINYGFEVGYTYSAVTNYETLTAAWHTYLTDDTSV